VLLRHGLATVLTAYWTLLFDFSLQRETGNLTKGHRGNDNGRHQLLESANNQLHSKEWKIAAARFNLRTESTKMEKH
jgi:hypothetical protein